MGEIMQAALAVKQAIRNEGTHPEFHRKVMAKHRQEWPTLWAALDALLDELERSASSPAI